ncbi:MAG: hypothetical protein ACXVEF_42050 [Polyangiales bacterium]
MHEVEDSLSSHYIGDVKAKGELRFVEFVVREKSLSRRVPDADAARALLGKFVDVGELSLISGDPYRFGPKG